MSLDTIAPPLDIAALVYFALAVFIYRVIVARRAETRGGLLGAIQEHRVNWMLNMAKREQRMLDAILLGSLSQGNAFFASTSAIAVGGLAATLGSGEKLQAMLAHLPFVSATTPAIVEAKQLLIMGIFIYAFFKFAWAFRISHYASIMIGATPNYDPAEQRGLHATRGADCRPHRRGCRAHQQRHALVLSRDRNDRLVLPSAAVHARDDMGDPHSCATRLLLPDSSPHSSAAVTSES